MRRTTLLLLAALRACGAKPHSFSIHEDVLAHPEFEVVFEDTFISEKEANRLVEGSLEEPARSDTPRPTDGADGLRKDENGLQLLTYEMVNMGDYKCLCSIPVLAPAPAENKTATELARAEEAREESRAVASGWELIGDLEDTCLYYVSGWWSYSFCGNREIVQYHALASSPKGQPPKRDLHSPEYVLGREPTIPSSSRSAESSTASDHDHELDVIPAELQDKGQQRYLVQKLQGGTICDLTERERTIEVQYHCVPGLETDKISWIKEVTICAYVMVIDTPRLCKDAAFLPPEPTKANAISCQLVSDEMSLLLEQAKESHENEEPDAEAETSVEIGEVEAAIAAAAANTLKELLHGVQNGAQKGKQVMVGDIAVGSRSLLSAADEAGRAPFKLTPPRSFMSSGGFAAEPKTPVVVAKGASRADGGEVVAMSRDELKKLDIDPDTVKDMADQIEKIAGDAGWRLEVSDSGLAGVRELKGYIDEEEEGPGEEREAELRAKAKQKREAKNKMKGAHEGNTKTAKQQQKQAQEGGEAEGEKEVTEVTEVTETTETQDKMLRLTPEPAVGAAGDEEKEEEEGSQEVFFKDEL